MTAGVHVLVGGPDEEQVAETAVALSRTDDAVHVETTVEPYQTEALAAADCAVATGDGQFLAAVREAAPSVPVVKFGAADDDRAAALLADGADDYVQRGTESQYVVLAHRIRAVAGESPAQGDSGGGGATIAQYEGIVEALDDGVYAFDADGTFTFANEAMAELTGYDADELHGEGPELIMDADSVQRARREIERLRSGETADIGTTFELSLQPKHGEPIPCEDHVTVLGDADGTFRGTVGVVRDISKRKRREEMITGLQETSRALMQAPSREEVADIVAGAAKKVLGFDLNVVRLYDAEERVLYPEAATDEIRETMVERPVYDLDEGQPGTVFASGEPAVYDDVRTLDGDHDLDPVRSAMYFPVGVHGTLSVASTTVGAFDDIDRQVAALLATNAAAACNRAKREQEVRETRERIATILERINGLIENTVEVLVEATTREAVEAGVCEQLADADPYVFAWLGRPDVRAETIAAREWAGDAPIDVSDVAVPMGADAPGARALAEDRPVVVDAEEIATADAGWIDQADAAGVESLMVIPLSYTDSTYGVLYVCADQPDAFDDREQVVLEALGRAVANAINAIESGRILSANKVIELEFTVDDRDLLFSRLSAGTGASVSSAGTVTQEDGSLRLYLTAEGGDQEGILETLQGDDAVESANRVAEHDGESLYDVTVSESLVGILVDHGAVPKSIESADGVARYAIELPYETEAREVFGLVEDRYGAVDLVGYHEHERPVRTQQEFRAALADRFTARQETALRTAYLGGFFEWPREVDGDELAGGMDISRPTYHQHLRAAQRKVFEELFES